VTETRQTLVFRTSTTFFSNINSFIISTLRASLLRKFSNFVESNFKSSVERKKVLVYRSLVQFMLLYTAETWTLRRTNDRCQLWGKWKILEYTRRRRLQNHRVEFQVEFRVTRISTRRNLCDKIYRLICSTILAGISSRWNVDLTLTLTLTLSLTLTLTLSHFYRAMHVVLARYCYRESWVRPSVRLSVCL